MSMCVKMMILLIILIIINNFIEPSKHNNLRINAILYPIANNDE
jgi:hypothetical protein